MARLDSDVRSVRVASRRTAQLLRMYADDFANCAEITETGEVIDGKTLTQALHEEAEILAHRVEAWVSALDELQSRLGDIERRFHPHGASN